MPYVPNTDDDQKRMLKAIGVSKIGDLFADIPQALRLNRDLNIPALPEMELLTEIEALSRDNREGLTCFAGGGVYDHFIPAAVNTIISRPEFVTSYTPYQAEVAQGTLQVIYEFQTHICRLTGMDIANASMYDGATAAAEAIRLTARITRRSKAIVSESVNPLYREVISTYLAGSDIEVVTLPMKDGVADLNRLADLVDDATAGVVLAQPNFFGLLEQIDAAVEVIHQAGAKLIMAVDPITQAVLKTPGDYGADIVVGEGQPLGIPLSFGGPLLGFFAAKQELARHMPGRIAGRTKDVDGKDGYVLTLQTREQHIRREKATSNICTNQALCATAASVYMSLLGKSGIKQIALLSIERAQQAALAIFELEGFEPYFSGPFVREFAVRTPRPARDIVLSMVENRVLPGVAAGRWYDGMDDCLIVALTEKRTPEDIATLVKGLKEFSVGLVSQM